MTLDLEKLSEVLGDFRESHDESDWEEWCELYDVREMSFLDVEEFWNTGRENTVCIDVGSHWLLVPREFAGKVLVLGIP